VPYISAPDRKLGVSKDGFQETNEWTQQKTKGAIVKGC